MPGVILPLDKLAKFDDGFQEFCRDPRSIVTIASWECNRLPELQGISVQPAAHGAWILLRNASNTFLLAEYDPDAARWKTFLVPDPKKALDELKSILGKWADILPILRTACAKAEPRVSEGTCSSPQRTPGSKYVENLLTEAFQYLNPEEFLRESIKRA